MKKLPGREQDYTFGQVMLTLRTAIGLTQAALAEYLGVSRHAVGEWEAGNTYPKAHHLRKFITLAVNQQVFAAGHEEEDIRALWRTARQKVLLDERWLASLLQQLPQAPAHSVRADAETSSLASAPIATGSSRMDWGEAMLVPSFYGREWELAQLTEWVVEERCQLVSVLGLGGIGKSALAIRLMHQLAERFDVVMWRSVRNGTSCQALLDGCLQVLAPQDLGQIADEPFVAGVSTNIERRLNLLLDHLRTRRVLLVLDNLETLLEEGDEMGRLRAGYEDYRRLLRQVAETKHQSCLLFTSREKPGDLVPLEGSRSPVRVLRLARLDAEACEHLLSDANVEGSAPERARLIDVYTGNPLALKIVTQTIVDLFDGEIAPFLKQEAIIFGGVRELLAQQFNRLSPVQRSVMFWLGIMREAVTFDELGGVLVTPVPRVQLLEAIEALRHRSLVERGRQPGSFTLQSVVLEYMTNRLITEVSDEIIEGTREGGRPARLTRLTEHGLTMALCSEYVRQTQERLLVAPVLEYLQSALSPERRLDERLEALLSALRSRANDAQGYAPTNVAMLLRQLRGDLHGIDLSGLVLRGAYLQGVEMQDASLANALVRDTALTETFGVILSVAASADGNYLAACSRQGDVRLWSATDYSLQQVLTDRDVLYLFALSPDGRTLAVIDWKGAIKAWDIVSGTLLWSADQPTDIINCMVFSPDGRFLITGDTKVALRDAQTGAQLQVLQDPIRPNDVRIPAISCSSNGQWLASGDMNGFIHLWALNGSGQVQAGEAREAREARGQPVLVKSIEGHTKAVVGLAFASDSGTVASASSDGTVKLWDVPSGSLQAILSGNRGPISRIAWSPDGRTVACGGQDQMIWLWEVAGGNYRAILRGHTSRIKGLAFTPDSCRLLSGGDEGMLRIWDVPSGQCVRVMQGHALAIYLVRWSPDGHRLVSASSDQLLTVFTVNPIKGVELAKDVPASESRSFSARQNELSKERRPPLLLRGHRRLIKGVVWSPDGRRVASCEQDNIIRLWDATSGECIRVLQHPDDSSTVFHSLDWSPDGHLLAAATPNHGVLLWDTSNTSGIRDITGVTTPRQHPARQLVTESTIVKWSPDGTRLASTNAPGGLTDSICVWAAVEGALLGRIGPMSGEISDFSWSPSGHLLVLSCKVGESEDVGAFSVWDTQHWACVHSLGGPDDVGNPLAWGPSEEMIISGSSDGSLKWWNIETGECVRVFPAHKGVVLDINRSPDGTKLASCGMDGAIMLWNLHTGEHIETVRRDRPYERLNITGIRGLTEPQKATLRALGAVEDAAMPSGKRAR